MVSGKYKIIGEYFMIIERKLCTKRYNNNCFHIIDYGIIIEIKAIEDWSLVKRNIERKTIKKWSDTS